MFIYRDILFYFVFYSRKEDRFQRVRKKNKFNCKMPETYIRSNIAELFIA